MNVEKDSTEKVLYDQYIEHSENDGSICKLSSIQKKKNIMILCIKFFKQKNT